MEKKPIQNCLPRFEFKCPKQWDALLETAEARVRLCGECQKQVYLCQSTQEAAAHARADHCVAVPTGLLSPSASDIPLRGLEIDPEMFQLIPLEFANRYSAVPLRLTGTVLTVAMSEPDNTVAIDDLRFLTGYTVEGVLASKQDIQETLERAQRELFSSVEMGVMCCEEPEPDLFEGPVGKLIRMVLVDGHQKQEAQVQIDITDSQIVVRYGLEGNRREFLSAPSKLRDELLRQLQHAARANPDQEGRLHVRARGQRIAYQVSFHPTALGQAVILQPLS